MCSYASPNHQQTPALFCSTVPKNSLQPAIWGVKIFSAMMKPCRASLMIFESLSFCPNNAAAGMESSHIGVSQWWNHQQSHENETESSYISLNPIFCVGKRWESCRRFTAPAPGQIPFVLPPESWINYHTVRNKAISRSSSIRLCLLKTLWHSKISSLLIARQLWPRIE